MAHIESGSTCKLLNMALKGTIHCCVVCSGTGNTVIEAVRVLNEHGLQAKHIILLSLFSTPHGETHTVKTHLCSHSVIHDICNLPIFFE